jgi:hypothetical protein
MYIFLKTHSFTLSIAAVGGSRLKNCLSVASFFKSRRQRDAQNSPKGRERGCPFLVPSFRQVKERKYKELIMIPIVHFVVGI